MQSLWHSLCLEVSIVQRLAQRLAWPSLPQGLVGNPAIRVESGLYATRGPSLPSYYTTLYGLCEWRAALVF